MSQEAGEWQLYWTARDQPVSCRLVPVLSGWADLDQREDAADIRPGHPVLIDPEYRLDPVLARFLGRSRFVWLADGTRQASRQGLPAVLLIAACGNGIDVLASAILRLAGEA